MANGLRVASITPEMLCEIQQKVDLIKANLENALQSLILILYGHVLAEEVGVSPDEMEAKSEFVKSLGLGVVPGPIRKYQNGFKVLFLCVGKTQELAEELLRCFIPGSTKICKEKDAEYGRLMGYPETAIEAFVQKKLIPFEDGELYDEFPDCPFQFRFSADHYKEEAQYRLEILKFLNLVAPEVFDYLVEEDAERTRKRLSAL